jgi:hypothetical protein
VKIGDALGLGCWCASVVFLACGMPLYAVATAILAHAAIQATTH